jgi:hypothetical protein
MLAKYWLVIVFRYENILKHLPMSISPFRSHKHLFYPAFRSKKKNTGNGNLM